MYPLASEKSRYAIQDPILMFVYYCSHATVKISCFMAIYDLFNVMQDHPMISSTPLPQHHQGCSLAYLTVPL